MVQANLLVDAWGTVKVSDFGLVSVSCSFAEATSVSASRDKGSIRWMAPEHVDPKQNVNKDRSTDAYAFAMTLWEVCCIDQDHKPMYSLLLGIYWGSTVLGDLRY
jgi:serine/threonine protein kinase